LLLMTNLLSRARIFQLRGGVGGSGL